MGQKRDLTAIEVGKFKKGEKFRAYAPDPMRPGRKIASAWGAYEEALEWRRNALAVKLDARRRKQQQKIQESLATGASDRLQVVPASDSWTMMMHTGDDLIVAAHAQARSTRATGS